jgi:MoxR-like ATPase
MGQRDLAGGSVTADSRLAELEAALALSLRGKPEVVRLSIVSLLGHGHLLLEDVPGVGKTTLAHALARASGCEFHRLQFTSDMLPSDVLGVTIYNSHSEQFEFKPGPIFTNFLLADEINRASPKTQSALLEAMNEQQVTVDGRSLPLPRPFMVIATQNPVEHHGTYPLPESQLDRFFMRLQIGYPDPLSERDILRNGGRFAHPQPPAAPILSQEELLVLQGAADRVSVDDALVDYMLAIVDRTRRHDSLALGVSPRGAQALFRATQAVALLEGREYALPDDVKRVVEPVCAHRLVIHPKAALGQRTAELSERILKEILTLVDVPL